MSEAKETNTEIKDRLFREKSLQRISSPEELNDYVRVANPGIWMILIAITVLLVGFCVWGVLGHLDTTVNAVVVTQNGESIGFISEDDVDQITDGMTVKCDGMDYYVTDISTHAVDSAEILSEYARHALDTYDGVWVNSFTIDRNTPSDGVFAAKVTIESINPISFILN